MATKPFNGIIKLDVRDSKEDWTPYLAPKAPPGSPNILFVLYDDTGLGAWSPFGGEIEMPTLQRVADKGLIYTQWHTAALCSPTRGMLLTGRNHHLNGNASITEGANGFPGQHARIPDECATVAQILQDSGWSTFWVGKNHNVPETDVAQGSTKKQWPLAKGFDRFYGFIGGETNQWYPDIIVDNHPVELDEHHKPGFEEVDEADGYHLSKDLANEAIQMIKDQKASNPSKPWYMWFCPGANHAPHHAPKRLINKYKDKFNDGYEAYRERVWKRMVDKGILPLGTHCTPINPLDEYKDVTGQDVANKDDHVRPWKDLTDQERDLFAKMMEVYAAFSEYTDEQVGRILDYLDATGQLENTVILYAADNGASGEGSPNGSVNENKFFNGYPDDIEENMKLINELGGPNTYEHFPTGWAVATSTPFKMFKRYSQYAGGTCDPLVISWPKGIAARGEIRHQYHHATDIVPTILEICKLEMPMYYKGVWQYPLSGVSMVYSFDAKPHGPTQKKRQYYAMLGTRGIWENGWKAVSIHAPLSGQAHFEDDDWELYHVDRDRSESKNVAAENPDMLRYLKEVWFEEAQKNLVLPLDDRSATEQLGVERPTEEEPREVYTYYPGTAPVPEAVAVNVRGRSYMIDADVTLDEGATGVIFAHGSRFGGHSLFIKDGKVHYVYNFLGIKPEQMFVSEVLETGRYIFRAQFIMESVGENGESIGKTELYVKSAATGNMMLAAGGPMRAQIGKFTLSGDGLCIGYDSADAVSEQYRGANPFKNGTIHWVSITPAAGSKPEYPERVHLGAFSAD